MSVAVSCPSCQKEYKVKADAAGKKFRCKACQTVVTVPQAESDDLDLAGLDPWEAVDESAPPPELPPRRVKSSSAGKTAKKRPSGEMPVTVMVSIGICGLLAVIVVGSAIVNLVTAGVNIFALVGVLVRFAILFTIIKGLLDRSNRIRWNAIILDIIGLVFMVPSLGLILVGSQLGAVKNIGTAQATFTILFIGLSIVLWIVDLVMLTHRSARDYCNQ